MFIQFIALIYIFTNISFYPGAEQYETAALPDVLKENAHAVVRTHETTFTIKSISSAVKRVQYAVTILDENAARNATIYVPYDKLIKVNYLKGTLYDKSGKELKSLKKTDIQDMSAISDFSIYEDNRVKAARLTHVQYPYTVEYEYEVTYNGLLYYPVWHPQDETYLSVEKATFRVVVPPGLKFRHKTINLAAKPEITTVDKIETYTWQATNLAALEEIPYQPALAEILPAVYTAPVDFEFEGYKGNMNSWASFGQWFNQLNAGKEKLPEATVTKLKALVADAPDDLAKIQKLYAYLQANTRYVSIQLGIGGFQPFEASFVDSKGYGDCKALSNYMHAMLKAVGINSLYTLIRAGEDENDIQLDFPSFQFNHAVLCVPQAKDSLWLECTSQTQSLGYAGNFTGNRHALMITPDGGKIVKTPVYNATDNLQKRKAMVQLDAAGNAAATVETIYTGLQQEDVSGLLTAGTEDQKKYLYNHIRIPTFDIKKFEFMQQKGRLPEVTENLTLNINKCGALSGKRLFLTPNLMNQISSIPPKVENRKLEVVTGWAYVDTDIIEYKLPTGVFQVEALPETQTVKSGFGEYTASFKMENDVLTYTRTFTRHKGRYPSTSYPELQDFYRKISKADKMQVVLVTK